jgi:hypothetical protein
MHVTAGESQIQKRGEVLLRMRQGSTPSAHFFAYFPYFEK